MKIKLATKWKAILCCLALIISMMGTGITVWAIARNYFNYSTGFEVNITGNRDVYATITGSSYENGSETAKQTLSPVVFNNSSTNTTENTSFTALNMENNEQISKFRFAITNNSPYTNHNDIIVKASSNIGDIDDVIVTWYYSTDNNEYFVYTGEYLVNHKNKTLYLELQILATQDMYGEIKLENNIDIDLHSEINKPTDFEYEYSYDYDNSTTIATKTQVCHTCDNCTHTYETKTMATNEYIVVDPYSYSGSTEKVSNKVIFLEGSYEYDLTYYNDLENVVFCQSSNSAAPIHSFALEVLNSDGNARFKNVSFVGLNFANNAINAHPSYDFSGQLSDFTLMSNIKFIDCTFAFSIFNIVAFDTYIDNLLIKNCQIGMADTPGSVYSIKNVNDLVVENSDFLNGIDFTFYNVHNAIISKSNQGYILPTLENASGEIYIINNNVDSCFSIESTAANTKIFIKNNVYSCGYNPYCLATVSKTIQTTIEFARNNLNFGEGDNFQKPSKYNKATIEEVKIG